MGQDNETHRIEFDEVQAKNTKKLDPNKSGLLGPESGFSGGIVTRKLLLAPMKQESQFKILKGSTTTENYRGRKNAQK